MQTSSGQTSAAGHTPAGAAFTQLILELFRLNGGLLAAGDGLTRDLGLTSARWQVLGAIDHEPLPVAQIARNMGLTRQAVQRVANDLVSQGFVAFADNPNHQRAKLVGLTDQGRRALDALNRRQAMWANGIAAGLDAAALYAATGVLRALRARLDNPGDHRWTPTCS
jgi:DNA-binding MarR family transcriptional regulator